jgi:hypothetical protein
MVYIGTGWVLGFKRQLESWWPGMSKLKGNRLPGNGAEKVVSGEVVIAVIGCLDNDCEHDYDSDYDYDYDNDNDNDYDTIKTK